MFKKLNNKGFSLVELIIVIAIIAILAAVLAPQFIRFLEDGRESTDVSMATNIDTVVNALAADSTLVVGDVVTWTTSTGAITVVDGDANADATAATAITSTLDAEAADLIVSSANAKTAATVTWTLNTDAVAGISIDQAVTGEGAKAVSAWAD